ncbi:hypothetical protein B0H11DRAFT_1685620, partial [Mycena galericulata]
AKARKVRWEEEVLLLHEEMRRVLHYLAWQVDWWRARMSVRPNTLLELHAGLAAYAAHQALAYEELVAYFKADWSVS